MLEKLECWKVGKLPPKKKCTSQVFLRDAPEIPFINLLEQTNNKTNEKVTIDYD